MQITIDKMPESVENGKYSVAAGKYEYYDGEICKHYKVIYQYDDLADVAKAILFLQGYPFIELEINE